MYIGSPEKDFFFIPRKSGKMYDNNAAGRPFTTSNEAESNHSDMHASFIPDLFGIEYRLSSVGSVPLIVIFAMNKLGG